MSRTPIGAVRQRVGNAVTFLRNQRSKGRRNRSRFRTLVLGSDERRSLLRPGLYRAFGTTVWRHWRTPVPAHMVATKAHHFIRGEGQPGRFERLIRRALDVVASPTVRVRAVRDHAGEGGRYSLVHLAYDGDVLLLGSDAGWVQRFAVEPRFTPEYVDLRRRFARHLPAAQFRVVATDVLLDQQIDGRHIDRRSPQTPRAVTELLRSYANLVEAEGCDSSVALLDDVRRAATAVRLPESLTIALDDATLEARVRRWPLVPARRDMSIENVVLVDDRPVLIDFERMWILPFFWDVFDLIRTGFGDPWDLPRDVQDGILGVFAAAGCQYDRVESIWTEVAPFFVAASAYLRAQTSPKGYDRAMFASRAQRYYDYFLGRRPTMV